MTISKDSPKRRKSIAVLNQNKPSGLARTKRRPHSIIGGDRLSPLAKSRRSLVPRKSILKSFTNTVHASDNANSQSQEPTSQSLPLTSSPDDPNATQSMDITRDFHAKISDNTTRKSFGGRRVSFAESVRVRLIEGSNKDNTNSTQSPQSSPIIEPSLQQPANRDENDYPGARIAGRRSSARYSIAYSEDMDLTSIEPQAFLQTDASAIADEEMPSEESDDGMDITGVMPAELLRRRSLSVGNRLPLTQLPQPAPLLPHSGEHDQSHSLEESVSQSISDDSNQSQQTDFTMPLSRSKRPPPERDEAWLALRNVTHSGDTPIEPEPSSDDYEHGDGRRPSNEMALDDAVQRLMLVRQSLPSNHAIPNEDEGHVSFDSTFSAEGSWEDQGDQTMNISVVLGQIGQDDVENGPTGKGPVTDDAFVPPSQSTPRQSEQHQVTSHQQLIPSPAPPEITHEIPRAPVFTPQVAAGSSSKPRAPVPSSPSKTKQPQVRTGFSAAFAQPVARSSPKKRSQSSNDSDTNNDRSTITSPSKRVAIASQDVSNNAPTPKALPKPLSPRKKAVFQPPEADPPTRPPSSSVRRPSGYFAKRKSLSSTSESQSQDGAANLISSPQKQPRLNFGRASVGSNPAHAWQQFTAASGSGTTKEGGTSRRDRETVSQSIATTGRDLSTSAVKNNQSPADLLAPHEPPANNARSLDDDEDEGSVENESMDMDITDQRRNVLDVSELSEPDPPISIQHFFTMTGIKFMDELSAPRRSTRPSQQGTLQARKREDIPLTDYAVATGIDIPQFVLYSRVSKDLDAWIEKSKADFEQAEDEASKITPQLFTEYSRADEDGQSQLLHHLQLIRTNARALAKSGWYDWKIQWLEGLGMAAAQTFQHLETDAKVLESIKLEVDDIIPVLRQEYDEIMRLLETESAEVAEIDACDQDYLNELKTSIAEQNIEVEALRAEVDESKAKQSSLQEQVDEINILRRENKAAIDDTRESLGDKKNETQAEVIRLKAELESLEDLHMFRATKVDPTIFEYVHASLFQVSIPCKNFRPFVGQLEISRLDKARTKVKDSFPSLSDFLLRSAKEFVIREEASAIRQIVHCLSDYWSSCAQLRAQLNLLSIKFPIDIEVMKGQENDARFKVKVMVLFPQIKAKAFIRFVFRDETFRYWPVAIHSLRCEVEVVYGSVDRDVINNAVAERLNQATPEDNYGCLFDACVLAQETYL